MDIEYSTEEELQPQCGTKQEHRATMNEPYKLSIPESKTKRAAPTWRLQRMLKRIASKLLPWLNNDLRKMLGHHAVDLIVRLPRHVILIVSFVPNFRVVSCMPKRGAIIEILVASISATCCKTSRHVEI